MPIAALLVVAGFAVLLSPIFFALPRDHLANLCDEKPIGDVTSPGGDYEALVTRDDCEKATGTVYSVHVRRDADGFEEPGVRPDPVDGEVAGRDAVRVRWASNDTPVISSRPSDDVGVSFDPSNSVVVRREFPRG